MSPASSARPRPGGRLAFAAACAVLAALVLASAWLRVAVAFADPGFDRTSPVGMLKSDPALLYYVTERVVEADGLLPADFRHDPRVEHPRGADLAELSVGEELLVGWTYPWLGRGEPLHVYAQRVMALSASLALVGVFLVALGCTGRPMWALFAAALASVLPANYRTIGWVLMREDLSLPLFALHAGAAAVAARAAGRARLLWALTSGIALAGALATWHALTFVAALEGAALAGAALLTGRNALGARAGLLALVPVVAAGVLVPALRANGFLFSAPMQIAVALAVLGAAARRRALAPLARVVVFFAVFGAAWLGAWLAARLGWSAAGELAHVHQLIAAKIRHGGALPADPASVRFDARLLWQGPFQTLELGFGARQLFTGLLAGANAAAILVYSARRGADAKSGPAESSPPLSASVPALALFTLISLPVAWLIARTIVLAGLALPAFAACGLARLKRRTALLVALPVLALQATLFASFARDHEISWYRPAGIAEELRALVAALPGLVPEDEAVCADFVNSTAVLAHTRRPIVLQPKYETQESRRDAEAFLTAFFHGTPEQLAALLRERFRSRYLLVDRDVLGYRSTWTAGLPRGAPFAPGTCAAIFLSQDQRELESVPGYELLYRSPTTILQSNGRPFDLFRLYKLRE